MRLHPQSAHRGHTAFGQSASGGMALITVEQFSRITLGIYESALNPANWAVALSDISSAVAPPIELVSPSAEPP